MSYCIILYYTKALKGLGTTAAIAAAASKIDVLQLFQELCIYICIYIYIYIYSYTCIHTYIRTLDE